MYKLVFTYVIFLVNELLLRLDNYSSTPAASGKGHRSASQLEGSGRTSFSKSFPSSLALCGDSSCSSFFDWRYWMRRQGSLHEIFVEISGSKPLVALFQMDWWKISSLFLFFMRVDLIFYEHIIALLSCPVVSPNNLFLFLRTGFFLSVLHVSEWFSCCSCLGESKMDLRFATLHFPRHYVHPPSPICMCLICWKDFVLLL